MNLSKALKALSGMVGPITLMIALCFVCVHLARAIWVTCYAGMATVDLAIFFEGCLSLLRGEPFTNAIQHIQLAGLQDYAQAPAILPGFTFHRNFILVLPAFCLAFYRHPVVLQVLAVIIALGALPGIWLLVRRHFSQPLWRGILFIVFLLLPGLSQATAGFMPAVFAIPVLTYFFVLLESRRWIGAGCMLLLFLFIREDYSIIACLLSAMLMAEQRYRRFALVAFAFSAVYGVFAILVYPALFASRQGALSALALFHAFGDQPVSIVQTMLSRPWFTISYALRPTVLLYLAALLGPFFPLCKTRSVLIVLPVAGIYALSGLNTSIQAHLHYSWPLLIIIYYYWLLHLKHHPRYRHLWIGLAICGLMSQNSLLFRPPFESNISFSTLIARGMSGQRQVIEEHLFMKATQRLQQQIPAHEGVAIDLRARRNWLAALTRNAPAVIFPRKVHTFNYIIRAQWPSARMKDPHLWSEFLVAQQLDASYFSGPHRLEWQKMDSYKEYDGTEISLWRRLTHESKAVK
ncbi:MAG: DUF2079 domain-containing protein [Leptospiraceae bacterium]|nr:DUF2079 domain-containing protein [Leptospiraceae bacterium]